MAVLELPLGCVWLCCSCHRGAYGFVGVAIRVCVAMLVMPVGVVWLCCCGVASRGCVAA